MTPQNHARDGLCAFGYCRAALVNRGRSRYCCDNHARAARSRQTIQATARRAAEAHYERIANGHAEPTPHLGIVRTTHGVVLDGTAVEELTALVRDLSDQVIAYRQRLKKAGWDDPYDDLQTNVVPIIRVTGQVDWGAGSQGWPSASWVSAW